MNLLPKSLKAQLISMIICMGIITIASSNYIIQTFWVQIIETDRDNSQELLKTDAIALLQKHRLLVDELSSRITIKKSFKKSVKAKDKAEIQKFLNAEFFQYYVTAEILDVAKIYVFDKHFNLLTKSSEGKDSGIEQLCPELIQIAKERKGLERVKGISTLCGEHEKSYFSSIKTIGTFNPSGYIQIVTNPVKAFDQLGFELHMPIQLSGPTGQSLFKSKNWRSPNQNHIEVKLVLKSLNEQNAIHITALKDISKLNQSINQSRRSVFLTVGLIFLVTLLIFYKLLDNSLIKPIKSLIKRLTLISTDKTQLSKDLKEEGSFEIRSLTSNFNQLTQHLSQLYQSLENMAYVDQLTALPNRSRLQEVLNFHHKQYLQRKIPYSLLMMDLDRFKSVNDTLGHTAGDKLLQQVSERLSQVLRKTDYVLTLSELDFPASDKDLVARLGGDEFAAVLPTAGDEEDIIVITKKIQEAMKEPFIVDKCHFSVGISIGIAQCPKHCENPDTLMRFADIAMYYCKANDLPYVFYTESIDNHSISLLTLDEELKKAIQTDGLSLQYQPKIKLPEETVIGVEALVRWVHPKHGTIFPDQFIPRAEQSSLINDLSKWVINTAMQQLAQWQKLGMDLSVAINLSPKNLLDNNLIPEIKKSLSENKVKPEQIYLEITETAIMSDPARSIVVLQELYDLGLQISIDDFGTGYSSLSYLKKLPAA